VRALSGACAWAAPDQTASIRTRTRTARMA
jgi:hypothetical protein